MGGEVWGGRGGRGGEGFTKSGIGPEFGGHLCRFRRILQAAVGPRLRARGGKRGGVAGRKKMKGLDRIKRNDEGNVAFTWCWIDECRGWRMRRIHTNVCVFRGV